MEDKVHTCQKRVFINDVDGYSSKHIAQFLSACRAEEASEDGEDVDEMSAFTPGEAFFQVVGTVSSACKEETLGFLRELYTSPTRDELLQHLLACDVVVYNVSESSTQQQVEEATWALTALHAEMENLESRKIFILVSTVMTWFMTKPQNPDDTDYLLMEEDFRRRRPHPRFKNHNNLEKHVLKLGRGKKSKLHGYVVAGGLQYGMGENLFHYFFKASWLMQLPKIPVFGQGTNYIPMIHVYDLGGVIKNIIELKPKTKYIVAVDDSKNTLEDIIQKISDLLGPEQIHKLPVQEALTSKALKPEELECLNINLCLDAFTIKNFSLRWRSEAGMVENMEQIIEEYKDTRKLLPVRICVVGPPAVGKTTVAAKLCHRYQIHYVEIKDIIDKKITQLKEIVSGDDSEDASKEEVAAAEMQLGNIEKCMEENQGQVDDELTFEILHEKLNSKPCQNQGFVLDGFPTTYDEARMIFSEEDKEDQYEALMTKKPVYNKNITPEYIFTLEASDDFLMKRVQGLPESVAQKMHYTQEEFVPRLNTYRQLNSAEDTVLHYFDELEIHPENIEVNTDDPDYTDAMKKITEAVGVPKNYGLSPEEQEEEDRKKEEERRQALAAEHAERKRRNEATLAEMKAQYEEWQKNLSEISQQEDELLEARALPLRNYLMKYAIPTLTKAMVECRTVKPEDPVDFLAEYLLTNNQQE